ncbi:hypothetical protein FRACA_1580012 [Frankia canadensis]|uniref:Uncharacterized protein n=1 Tax=Frankia canadensis TaxID=1836972 RepID=A0A2I2KMF6_9ACTN|nr:hypothetical protein FRACA_1580012 [Frankia canadensis]SOU54122.1 hypothetical protein FRACA_1580012 [Frankia canadensis]
MENEPTTATEWFATAWRAHLVASFGLLLSLQVFISICLPLIPPLALTAVAAAFADAISSGKFGGLELVGAITVSATESLGLPPLPELSLLHAVNATAAAHNAIPLAVTRRRTRIQNPSNVICLSEQQTIRDASAYV